MAESKGCANELRNVTRGAASSTIAGVEAPQARGSGVRDEEGMGVAMFQTTVYTRGENAEQRGSTGYFLVFGRFRGLHSFRRLFVLAREALDAAGRVDELLFCR